MPTVRTMTSADENAAVNTILLAFAGDPVARWTWTTASQYLDAMPRLTRAFGGRAFLHGSAYCSGSHGGAALWLPPGVHPDDEALAALIEGTVPESARGDVNGLFERMAGYHPTVPHWYLPLIGVDPIHQGQGHGDALMSYALSRCDADRVPAYLESTNPRNISLYKRHGFTELGAIQVGASPTLVPMLRPAR